MGQTRPVTLITEHDDTAELYRLVLEQAGFRTERFDTVDRAVSAPRSQPPAAIIVQFTPRQDPAAVGRILRSSNPDVVLIGLFSIQLPLSTLRHVLHHFDDVIMIPCTPEALVAHVVRLQERKNRQASA